MPLVLPLLPYLVAVPSFTAPPPPSPRRLRHPPGALVQLRSPGAAAAWLAACGGGSVPFLHEGRQWTVAPSDAADAHGGDGGASEFRIRMSQCRRGAL